MVQKIYHIALSDLCRTDTKLELIGNPDVTFDTYTSFKYGSGESSNLFGIQLAGIIDKELAELGHKNTENILITSSGYGNVPPAASSLVAPIVEHSHFSLKPFKTLRAGITNGDYANMDLNERMKHLNAKSLTPQINVSGKFVVSVDDIVMTGVHEKAMADTLLEHGATGVLSVCVVDGKKLNSDPHTEAMLNASGVRTNEELLHIVNSEHFIPNARFAKRIINMPEHEQRDMMDKIPFDIINWIVSAIESDNMASVESYKEGCKNFFANYQRLHFKNMN